MLNSHSSSFSLAGGRRACPALKPDAADQVLLKNRAGFAAFSKGRTFHHVWNRIAARVTGRRGPAGAIRWIGCTGSAGIRLDGGVLLWAMPVAQDVSPRLIPLVVSLVPRILLGFSHYCGVSDHAHGGGAIRTGHGRCGASPAHNEQKWVAGPSGRDGRTGRASLQRGWWGHPAMRAYGWRGPCMHTGGWLYGSSRRGMRRDMPGGAYHF